MLGYPIDICPKCQGVTHDVEGTYYCPSCGKLDEGEILQYILCLPRNIAGHVYRSKRYGPITQYDVGIIASVNSVMVNTWADGAVKYDFPTIFPHIPQDGDVVIIGDIPKLSEAPPNTIAYHGKWMATWSPYFEGRRVTILYDDDLKWAKDASRSLEKYADVHIGRWTGDYEADIDNALIKADEEEKALDFKSLTLRDVIDSRHNVYGPAGTIYRTQINQPPWRVVDDCRLWFDIHGARWIWDMDNMCQFMLFNGDIIKVDGNDPIFRSLLQKIGGISKVSKEGARIMDGLSNQYHDSEKVYPVPWINRVGDSIHIIQGKEKIIIKANSVTLAPSEDISYGQLHPDQQRFVPISITDGVALKELMTLVADYFPLPDSGREIVLCWLLGIFLKDWAAIRPGVRVSGDASSGKSTMLLLLYNLLYGTGSGTLPSLGTTAGFWRFAAMEPLLPLDNANASRLKDDDSFRTFLDLCATGGERMLGTSANLTELKSQKAHSLVIISGLDDFLDHDVRTRYIEVRTDEEYKSRFSQVTDMGLLLEKRDAMMSSVFRLIAYEVLPNVGDYINKDNIFLAKQLLGTKERIADYFVLMVAIGEALQKKGVFPPGDIPVRWCEYIRENADKTAVSNAQTIEWWNNFKFFISKYSDEYLRFVEGGIKTDIPFELLTDNGRRVGIRGDWEVMMIALSKCASTLKRHLPWRSTKELKVAHETDRDAWASLGWSIVTNGTIEIRWGDGV